MTPEQWNEVRRLFDASMALSDSQRAEFLARLAPPRRHAVKRRIPTGAREPDLSFIERPALDEAASVIRRHRRKLGIVTAAFDRSAKPGSRRH